MRGLTAFVLVLPVGHSVTDNELANAFLDTGFTVLATRGLTDEQARSVLSSDCRVAITRAGQLHLIVAFDAWPQTPMTHKRLRHGSLDNQRTLKAIQRAGMRLGCSRRRIKKNHLPRFGATLNGAQALETAKACGLDVPTLLASAKTIVDSVRVPDSVVQEIPSVRLRARLDIVAAAGCNVVRKTFLPSFAAYAGRESKARAVLAPTIAFVDPVLDAGQNYFTIPLYHAPELPGPNSLRLLPISHARTAIKVMREFYESGYALLDCNPHSILYATDGSPRVVDLEYVHKYEARPVRFEDSYDVKGPPKGSTLPGAHIADSFDRRWRPWIGLTFEDLMRRSVAVLRLKRAIFILTRRLPRLVSVTVRDGVRVLRDLMIGCVRQYLLRRHPDRLYL